MWNLFLNKDGLEGKRGKGNNHQNVGKENVGFHDK